MKVLFCLCFPFVTACLAADVGMIPQVKELEKRVRVDGKHIDRKDIAHCCIRCSNATVVYLFQKLLLVQEICESVRLRRVSILSTKNNITPIPGRFQLFYYARRRRMFFSDNTTQTPLVLQLLIYMIII